jgi:osmotically inducible protein OsmC
MLKREANAVWTGGLKDGGGRLTSSSGVLRDTPYSFTTRFEQTPGTNPEELVAAAHAGCFSMALSGVLGESGLKAERIETRATVTLEKLEAGWTLTKVHLDLSARVPGADPAKLRAAAEQAKAGCPISRVLKSEITLTAHFD